MKTKIILLGALITSSFVFGQQFPHVATSNGNAERVASFRVNESSTEFLEITNSTEFAGQFIPSIWAHHQADNRFVLRHFATTNSTMDNGTIPIMIFRAELRNSLNLTAPNGSGNFPWGTTSANVVNRPLFAWENGATQLMRILANGNVGIGTITPSTRFHTNGSLRFENIPTVSTNTYVLTTDSNGVVSRQLSTSFGGGLANSCNTTNFLTKKGTTELTCSQIFDNGLNVGIGTTSPSFKLDVNGTIRATDITTISDAKYKKDVESINDALGKILRLDGKSYKWNISEFKEMNFNDKLQYGLIAQEVEKVLPALAYKSENGEYSVNYIGIIPILIEAIKQQQEQIIALQDGQNTGFQKQNSDLINLKNTKIISVSPNPSSDIIVISLNVEESVQDAKLVVYDLNGNIISSLNIKERRNNITKSLQKDNFDHGIYIVSLFINGKSLDTKKIIFN